MDIGEIESYPDDLPAHLRMPWEAALKVYSKKTDVLETFFKDANITFTNTNSKKARQKVRRQFRWWFHNNIWGKS